MNIIKAMCHLKMVITHAEARRSIQSGLVFVNDKKVVTDKKQVFHGDKIRLGKRRVGNLS